MKAATSFYLLGDILAVRGEPLQFNNFLNSASLPVARMKERKNKKKQKNKNTSVGLGLDAGGCPNSGLS